MYAVTVDEKLLQLGEIFFFLFLFSFLDCAFVFVFSPSVSQTCMVYWKCKCRGLQFTVAMRSEQTKNEEKRREKYRVVTSDGLVGWFNPN